MLSYLSPASFNFMVSLMLPLHFNTTTALFSTCSASVLTYSRTVKCWRLISTIYRRKFENKTEKSESRYFGRRYFSMSIFWASIFWPRYFGQKPMQLQSTLDITAPRYNVTLDITSPWLGPIWLALKEIKAK